MPCFVQPTWLDAVKEYIAQQERVYKITKKANKCANFHNTGNNVCNESTWKACNNTGIMGLCCQHDSIRFLAGVEEDRPVGVLNDLGCSLDNAKYGLNHVLQLNSEPRSSTPMSMNGHAMSNMIHDINKDGACATKISPLRYNARNNRLAALSHHCKPWNQQSSIKLAAWLRKQLDQVLVCRDLEKSVISELAQTLNPNPTEQSNYMVAFFRSQWENQV
ncbi:hypothetical protein PSTG_10312 [Puccinia striiformis f. sp. tritici PST-78]|uniref:CxC1-like cysteine cluster associated with KDZ transposases domain-containing protein n=1 Tax=Puccinia striiformis f. sp. tritici PST-78 TaxID=1165861 RepID=A0A0L0VAM1_9BASI|nr:hypothetical protein PSTG_10312 [Puccinia striiformis f. sp. tritici PST-78]